MNTILLIASVTLILISIALWIVLLVRTRKVKLTTAEAASLMARRGAEKREAARQRKIDAMTERLRGELGR